MLLWINSDCMWSSVWSSVSLTLCVRGGGGGGGFVNLLCNEFPSFFDLYIRNFMY